MDKKGALHIAAILAILAGGILIRMLPSAGAALGLIGADGFFHSFAVSETIRTGSLPEYDPYSWGGRPLNYFPGFHLLSAALLGSTGIGIAGAHLIGPLMFVLSGIAALAIARRLQANPAILLAILAFTPIIIWKTSTNFLPDSLVIFFLMFSSFIAPQGALPVLITSLVTGALVHPVLLFAFIPAFAIGIRSRFRVFAIALAFLLAASIYGISGFEYSSDIWQGTPIQMRDQLFSGIDITRAVKAIGPAAAGPFLVPQTIALLSFFLPTIPAAFGLIEPDRALLIAAISMAISLSIFLSKRKRFPQFLAILACIAMAISQLPALSWAPVTRQSADSLGWISLNTQTGSTILTTPGDGYLAAYVARRKNSIDGHFSGAPANSSERMAEVVSAIRDDPAIAVEKLAAATLLVTRRSYGEVSPSRSWRLVQESLESDGTYSRAFVAG